MSSKDVGKITLWGVDGEPLALSRPGDPTCDGIRLVTVPAFLSGDSVEHVFDEATGEHKAMKTTGVKQPRLDLNAVGANPRQLVHELLQALGDGSRPVSISAVSPQLGWRWKRMFFKEISEINWHGHAAGSPLVTFSILLETAKRNWSRFPDSFTLGPDTDWGEIPFTIDGDQDVWPRLTISGAHEGVTVKLTPMDDEQTIPPSSSGWVIDSHPEHRVVADLDGVQLFNGFVPFWPEPVANLAGKGTIFIDVNMPGDDFKITVDFTPEVSRAW